MRRPVIIGACLLMAGMQLQAQPQFELSRNVYRLPYMAGINVTINNDHYTHDPLGRYDLKGSGNGGDCGTNYPIVAAAEGIIRRIVDNHSLHGPDCSSNCTDFNNYVWIEHANGEWTKYSHMKYNSTTGDAGLSVGDQVCAGTFLGYECDIGQASGPHLHFEVRHPNDPGNVQIQLPVVLCRMRHIAFPSSIPYPSIIWKTAINGRHQDQRSAPPYLSLYPHPSLSAIMV